MTVLLATPFLSLAVVLALLMRSGGSPRGRTGSIQYVRCGNCGAVLGLNGEADVRAGVGRDHRCTT